MTNEATIEKMRRMKLTGMADAFQNTFTGKLDQQFTNDELIGHLIDAEWDERYNRKLSRLIRGAKFRYQASFESIDYIKSRKLDKNLILRFSNCDWIRKAEKIIITGPTGIGKSFLGSALGNQACKNGFKVIYLNAMKLFSMLKTSKGDGSYVNEMKRLQRCDVLIIDDFGLEVLDTVSRLMFLELIEDRNGTKSIVITSQLPVSKWFEVIGDPTIADAICDRIIHSSHKIELDGDSMRKYYDGRKNSAPILDETCHLD